MEEGERREPSGEAVPDAGGADGDELRTRIGIKDNRIRELIEESTALRLAADEALAVREAGRGHIEAIERDRERLRERVGELEEGSRDRRRRRDGTERRISRLEREIERKDGEISRRDHLLERRAGEVDEARRAAEEDATRRDASLRTALGRVEGLERDLEDREAEISNLQARIDDLREELDAERRLREDLADRDNRLRTGIDLFNESEGLRSANALSRTLGRPEVHVGLGPGEQPPALISFTWRGVTWQTYAADPNPAVKDPRVYLTDSGEDLSGVDREPPNAHVAPGGRVVLGL